MSTTNYPRPSKCPSCGKDWSLGGISRIITKYDNDGDESGQIRYMKCYYCGDDVKHDESFYYSDMDY